MMYILECSFETIYLRGACNAHIIIIDYCDMIKYSVQNDENDFHFDCVISQLNILFKYYPH